MQCPYFLGKKKACGPTDAFTLQIKYQKCNPRKTNPLTNTITKSFTRKACRWAAGSFVFPPAFRALSRFFCLSSRESQLPGLALAPLPNCSKTELLPGIGLSLVSVFLKYLPQFFSFS
jgi:hypothetical protein